MRTEREPILEIGTSGRWKVGGSSLCCSPFRCRHYSDGYRGRGRSTTDILAGRARSQGSPIKRRDKSAQDAGELSVTESITEGTRYLIFPRYTSRTIEYRSRFYASPGIERERVSMLVGKSWWDAIVRSERESLRDRPRDVNRIAPRLSRRMMAILAVCGVNSVRKREKAKSKLSFFF